MMVVKLMKGSETISSKEYFVGIDIGGTNTKTIAMNRKVKFSMRKSYLMKVFLSKEG